MTHPTASGRPSQPAEAQRFLSSPADAGGEVWSPGTGFPLRLAQLAADLDIRGNRIFDLQIALCAFEGSACELWSRDAKFVVVSGLGLVRPLGRLLS